MKKNKKTYYSLKSFATYMSAYKLRAAIVMLGFILSNILIALIPIFIGKLVGALAANPVQGHQAVIYVWVLIGCSSGHNILWRLSELLHMKLVNPIGYRYENILFQEVIQKPYPYFVDKFTGKISSYITSTSQELRDFLTNIFYEYSSQIVSLVVVTFILLSVNWQTGTIFIIGIISLFIVGRKTIQNSSKYEKLTTDIYSTKNGKLIDAIANFVNVKSFQQESREVDTVKVEQEKTIKAATKSYVWAVFFWGSMSFIIRDLLWPATIGLNVYLFLHGSLTIAQLATLLTTILLFSSTIWNLIWQISQFNLKLARMEESHRYLFGETNVMKDRLNRIETALPLPEFTNQLSINNLSFAYPDKKDVHVLDAISLSLKKGEKLGIVGKSGSGKTTLTKLLLGYYPAKNEQIVLDGKTISGGELARLISYVPQDTSLFHRTIAENIAYAANRKVTQEDIVKAAKRAHAHEFITQISDDYEALVGERGVKLSAGQRQRVAIARALLDDKPLLILDEATSALDSESEILVQQGLEALWEEKTVIAIAHRLSTLRHMDKIIVMNKGKIIESGTHTELIKKDGAYAKLWNHQSGGFLDEE